MCCRAGSCGARRAAPGCLEAGEPRCRRPTRRRRAAVPRRCRGRRWRGRRGHGGGRGRWRRPTSRLKCCCHGCRCRPRCADGGCAAGRRRWRRHQRRTATPPCPGTRWRPAARGRRLRARPGLRRSTAPSPARRQSRRTVPFPDRLANGRGWQWPRRRGFPSSQQSRESGRCATCRPGSACAAGGVSTRHNVHRHGLASGTAGCPSAGRWR